MSKPKLSFFGAVSYVMQYAPLIERVETDLDTLHAAGTEQARRAAIGDIFSGAIDTADSIVSAKNPAHAAEIESLSKVLQDAAALWVSQAAQPPAPSPQPPPVSVIDINTFTWYPNPIPTDNDLRQRSGMARGTLWLNTQSTQWAITSQGQTMLDGALPRPF